MWGILCLLNYLCGLIFKHLISVAGSNPIYNLLPDILSKLSSQDLAGESFCNIMQFLIGSIKKVSFVHSCLATAVIIFVFLDLFNWLWNLFRTNKWNLLLRNFATDSVESQVWVLSTVENFWNLEFCWTDTCFIFKYFMSSFQKVIVTWFLTNNPLKGVYFLYEISINQSTLLCTQIYFPCYMWTIDGKKLKITSIKMSLFHF